jgi:uridylate kinase
MGLLATRIKSMAIAYFLKTQEIAPEIFSAFPMLNICEMYYSRHAQKAMEDRKTALLAEGQCIFFNG